MLWLYTELTPSENKQHQICFTLYVQGSSLASSVFQKEKLRLNHKVMRRESNRLSASNPALTEVKEQPASPLTPVACGLHPPSSLLLCLHRRIATVTEAKRLRRNGLLEPEEGFLTDFRTFHAEQEVNCRAEAKRREVW